MARFGDALATGPDLQDAARTAVGDALRHLDGAVDLLCVFVCGDDPEEVARAGELAMELGGARTTVGCSASGVIGAGRGMELTSAVSVWAAVLPDVRIAPFHLEAVRGTESLVVTGLPDRDADDAAAVLLADPFSFPADAFVERSNEALRGLPFVGGMATGQRGEGSTRLFMDGKVLDRGAVGVMLGGQVAVRPLVSQGCRPVGPPMAVTRAAGNVVRELAGTPALTKLEEIVSGLDEADRELVSNGLHVGVAIDEYSEEHERGDFLIRGVVGVDSEDRSSLVIGDVVEIGQTLRFQVRDAHTADEDLTETLERFRRDPDFGPVESALLFSCNGRGSGLFSSPDHDALAVRHGLEVSGVGGFFAAGEIGPVGGRNHVHGFTASLLAFGPSGSVGPATPAGK